MVVISEAKTLGKRLEQRYPSSGDGSLDWDWQASRVNPQLSPFANDLTREVTHLISDLQHVALGDIETLRLLRMVRMLKDPAIREEVASGRITIAAIKPWANRTKVGDLDDSELVTNTDVAAEYYLVNREIKLPLQVIARVSFNLSREDLMEFYPNVYKALIEKASLAFPGKQTRWDDFVDYMTSGPVTFLVLHDGVGAVEEWRRQLGATDPKAAHPESLRGRFGASIGANVGHGSSDVESVVAEFDWVASRLGRLLRNSGDVYPDEADLKKSGLIPYEARLIAIGRIPCTPKLRAVYKNAQAEIHSVEFFLNN
ncbi:MAG: nucleoside-diphosphate kinase [Patescibacteria group bacterium]